MKIAFLAALLIICKLICFGQDTTYFTAEWKASQKTGAAFYRVNKKGGAKWLRSDYYIGNKQLQMKGTFTSLNPEIKDGDFIWYFENGKVKHTGTYVQDKPVGKHLWFNNNGKQDAVENYKNGKYDGSYEEYYENGQLKSKALFVDGVQHGWTTYFAEDGIKHSEGNFKNGSRDGAWRYYKGDMLLGIDTFKTEYEIKEAGIFLRLPNDSWHLTPTPPGNPIQYIFKRDVIMDSKGQSIIPAIMVWYTSATNYDNDLTLLIKERLGSMPMLVTEKVLRPTDKGYPLPFKNAAFYKTSYVERGEAHVLYIIYYINKKGLAFQIGLDMTKDINARYDAEFWETIRSLKDL
jgi:hypothetical protein